MWLLGMWLLLVLPDFCFHLLLSLGCCIIPSHPYDQHLLPCLAAFMVLCSVCSSTLHLPLYAFFFYRLSCSDLINGFFCLDQL